MSESCWQVVERAAEQGVAVGVARNLSHFGFGGCDEGEGESHVRNIVLCPGLTRSDRYYTEMAAARGQIGIVMCNTEPAANPFGGKGKVWADTHTPSTTLLHTGVSMVGRVSAAAAAGARHEPHLVLVPPARRAPAVQGCSCSLVLSY